MNIEQLKEKQAKEMAELERKLAICEQLPHKEKPLISFHRYLGEGSLLYRKQTKESAIQIFQELTSSWELIEPSKVKYGNYRESIYPSRNPPKEKRVSKLQSKGDELKSSEPIHPVYLDLSTGNGYSRTEVSFFVKNHDGEIFNAHIEVHTRFNLYGRREEFKGGWRYSSAVIGGMGDIPFVYSSGAYKNTEQSLSGLVTFCPKINNTIELLQSIIN